MGATGVSWGYGSSGYEGLVVISYVPTVTLADHAAGQESNKLAGVTWVQGRGAVRVQAHQQHRQLGQRHPAPVPAVRGDAASPRATSATSSSTRTPTTTAAIAAGETTTVGGTGAANAGMTTITFSTSFAVAASTTVNYILKGNATNLAPTTR